MLLQPLYWGLDPLFSTHVKFTLLDIHKLEYREDYDIYFFKGRPLRFTEIVGVVVGIERKENFIIYILDDATATLPCICWHIPHQEMKMNIELGSLIRVRGKLGMWKEERQVSTSNIQEINDPNEEVLHMLEVRRLHEVYSTPFQMSSLVEAKKTELQAKLSEE
ncbi:uncharacterized protein VTP21DRAFT_6397 [Calcarisporiella thermophila]|uniref:uncharacterized protein n=1 Tax=Calcarisporiella thermophila TaxID=911321 RepID=UPI0037429B44